MKKRLFAKFTNDAGLWPIVKQIVLSFRDKEYKHASLGGGGDIPVLALELPLSSSNYLILRRKIHWYIRSR